jgi:peptide-methionine (S)-S-oxide reductase
LKIALALITLLLLPSRAAAEQAVFAGGCYWGVEAVFEHVRGVTAATSGFVDGVESVVVEYDPSAVTYRQLLEVFFRVAHDPTSRDRQGPDAGPEYRAIVFHGNAAQRAEAEAYIEELRRSAVFATPIVTELQRLGAFHPAPPDQQDYAARNPTQPYIVINDQPKLDHLRREFPQLYVRKN